MTNPFTSGNNNPADQLHVDGRQITGVGGGASPNSVIYDPATKAVNPAGVALVQDLMKQVQQREDALIKRFEDREKMLLRVVAKAVGKRLEPIEAALDVTRAEVADAIQTAATGFFDDDPAPTVEDLKRMHAQHKKDMKDA
ncbi:hypothetical protein [Shimia sagamensis]|uniref:Uncharacterized protein n=1 Tax=Shimia sagamensis TaxID=1566352 RepID=A0ABY1PJY4_9RHOB|nr:hypothetical protein [Shimia sagamensis]SMP35328.1 hypothetical protein SAMN06265373_11169 [Shimia sagamensis]